MVDKEIVSKLKTEESILKLLGSNQSVVDSTVERLNNLKVKPNDLLDTDICFFQSLFTLTLKLHYSSVS